LHADDDGSVMSLRTWIRYRNSPKISSPHAPHVYVRLAPLCPTFTLDQSHMLGIDNAMYSLPRVRQDQVPALDHHAITPRRARRAAAICQPSLRFLHIALRLMTLCPHPICALTLARAVSRPIAPRALHSWLRQAGVHAPDRGVSTRAKWQMAMY
jgi:hypothetical protein